MNIALFDFDGTITFKDSFKPFLYRAANPARIATGRLLLIPLILGYKLRIIPASVTRACVVAFGFRGRLESEVRKAGLDYATHVLPATVRPKALERIDWHKRQGDVVAVVSAALDVYLVEWCRQMGLDVICTELESKDGVLTGRYRGGDCVHWEKVRRIRERYRLQDYETVYAYGDTAEDNEMLSIASTRFYRWQEMTGQVTYNQNTDHVDQEPNR